MQEYEECDRVFIGIDNGVTGSIGVIDSDRKVLDFFKTPTIRCLEYTKTKQWVNRVDAKKMLSIFEKYATYFNCSVLIERPMVNPGRFKATKSALRCLEATLIVLEFVSMPYSFIDSKEWQKAILPNGLKKEELKNASLSIAKRLFPGLDFSGFKDADGLLIAEYARMKKL